MMKVISIGEVLIDCFKNEKIIGGAPFNFFYHIHKLTGNSEFISRIGNDDDGRLILDFCADKNINTSYLQIDKKYPTGRVDIKINRNGLHKFKIKPDCAYDFIERNDKTNRLIQEEASLLYYGTLAQRGTVSRTTIQSLLAYDKRFFCDINLRSNYYNKPLLEVCFQQADVLKLNLEELIISSEYFLGSKFALHKSAEDLRNKFDFDTLSVTLGQKGALLINSSGKNEYMHPVDKIIDTIGAGDAYAAILCLGYLNNTPIDKINMVANEFAAYICTINGAIPFNDRIYEKIKAKLIN